MNVSWNVAQNVRFGNTRRLVVNVNRLRKAETLIYVIKTRLRIRAPKVEIQKRELFLFIKVIYKITNNRIIT